LTGDTAPLERGALAALFAVPHGDWLDVEDSPTVRELRTRGLLIGEEDDELSRRDEVLAQTRWHPAAACFHFATKLRHVDLGLPGDPDRIAAEAEAAAARFVDRHGPAPPHFHSLGATPVVELPVVRGEGGLYEALDRRRTTRGFDRTTPLSLEQIALLVYEVFRCRAYSAIHPEIVALRKASPSGGGLHPVEVYPLIRDVAGLEPGLYHYSLREHALESMATFSADEAAKTISAFTAGQLWFADAAAVFVLTARFRRNFWKYRRHQKAYATLLLDVAHLSQAFYLVCADLGLGAFFTNLVDGASIEEALGLDGYSEGALALCGCGIPSTRPSPLEPEFLPYVPGKTAI
jgi:putative peptide maturation dehydrogenase